MRENRDQDHHKSREKDGEDGDEAGHFLFGLKGRTLNAQLSTLNFEIGIKTNIQHPTLNIQHSSEDLGALH
jgi:hypothetical protein